MDGSGWWYGTSGCVTIDAGGALKWYGMVIEENICN